MDAKIEGGNGVEEKQRYPPIPKPDVLMTGKEMLQRDKAAFVWWTEMSSHPHFAFVLVCAKADMFASGMPDAQLTGANRCITTLEQLADAPESDRRMPSPGLVHENPTNRKAL